MKFTFNGIHHCNDKKHFSLILPEAKKYKIDTILKYKEIVQHHRLIRKAVTSSYSNTAKQSEKPPVIYTKSGKIIPLHDTLHNIFSMHPLPLNQGPVILPLDCYQEMPEKKMMSLRTEFGHSPEQDCYEWIPIDDGISCWKIKLIGNLEIERNHYKVKELSYNIAGPSSSKENMNMLYTCTGHNCIIHCPCQICKDSRNNCKFHCREKMCNKCNSQCTNHDLKFPRLFNVETDQFTMVANEIRYFRYAVPHAGIPSNCESCKTDVLEHQTLHLIFHLRCKFCCQLFKPFEKEEIVTLQDFNEADRNLLKKERQTCSICFKIFNSKEARKSHEKNIHKKVHTCDECDKQYANAVNLNYHKSTRHDITVKKVDCPNCSATFSTENNMLIHKRRTHGKAPQDSGYECEDCDKTFSYENNLNRHRREYHHITEFNLDYVNSENLRNICDQCTETFSRKSSLIRHKATFHGGENVTIQCDQCSKTFNRNSNMIRHKENAHNKVEDKRKFECDTCRKSFSRKDALQRHTDKQH